MLFAGAPLEFVLLGKEDGIHFNLVLGTACNNAEPYVFYHRAWSEVDRCCPSHLAGIPDGNLGRLRRLLELNCSGSVVVRGNYGNAKISYKRRNAAGRAF
jgi:hypothetical protein